MILSASRRTDIPAFYSEWFFNRLNESYLCVRNPMNVHQVRKIALSPNVIDCIVFWSKNPAPMINRLHELERYKYYFQFTLNNYGPEIEPNVPSLDERINIFEALSKSLNYERIKIVWRYDPIFFSDEYSIKFHVDTFRKLSGILSDFTDTCVISFLDKYKNISYDMSRLGIEDDNEEKQRELAENFSGIAKEYGIKINTCAEKINLSEFGIGHSSCIDKKRIESITGYKLSVKKDKSQRQECGCYESIDIGAYDTCIHGCIYCYARRRKNNMSGECRIDSPVLCGEINNDDKVKEERPESLRERQKSIFDS